ncbi:MAG: hypothetical protein WCO50_01580 [Synechococcus sp. ELA619]
MHHIPLTQDQQKLAEALDGHLREAQQLALALEAAGVCHGLGGLALRQCGELLGEAGFWSTGLLVTGGVRGTQRESPFEVEPLTLSLTPPCLNR